MNEIEMCFYLTGVGVNEKCYALISDYAVVSPPCS